MSWKGRLKGLVLFLQRENLLRLMLVLSGLLFLSTVGFALFEPDTTWLNAVWWSIVTMTTVGYGDISPVTVGGRIIGTVVMFLGIGLLGIVTATLASLLVERRIREDKGMRSYEFEDHFILCEWNLRSREILQELRCDQRTETVPVVLIAEIESKPVDDDLLFFIRGDVSEENLQRANLAKATTVVILGDDRLEAGARDAKAVLSTLTVESINPAAYTIVELVSGANVQHCRRANADEVIVVSEFGSKLIARAALDHGISTVLSELLSSRVGDELQKLPLPEPLAGREFLEVMATMKREHRCTVLAVQKGGDGTVLSNPPAEYRVEAGDSLIVIAPGPGR